MRGFGVGKRCLEDSGVHEKLILRWLLEKRYIGRGWIGFIWAENTDRWRTLVNRVINKSCDTKKSTVI